MTAMKRNLLGRHSKTVSLVVLLFVLFELGGCAKEVEGDVVQTAVIMATALPTQALIFTPTVVPTFTPTPAPTATPAPSLRRLTEPGCCTQPGWTPDSRQVLFVDRPAPDAPVGFYAVNVTRPDAAPVLITDRMLTYAADFQAAVYPRGDLAIVEKLSAAFGKEPIQRWEVNTLGNQPALSPDNSRLVWQDTAEAGPYNTRRTQVWLAELAEDNTPESELVLSVYGGGAAAWFPDNQRLLISARPVLTVEERVLLVFSLADRSMQELARAQRISRIALSPGGSWVAYLLTFSDNPGDDGIWLVRTTGTARYKVDVFGALQWRDDTHLLVIPMEPGAASDVVWQLDAESGTAKSLTDPAITSFKIAGGDWSVSPDGMHIVFVNAQDRALWLLTFGG